MHLFTRRRLLTGAVGSALVPLTGLFRQARSQPKGRGNSLGFLEIGRSPDVATAFLGLDRPLTLRRSGPRWETSQVSVRVGPGGSELPIYISAGLNALTHIQLRWEMDVSESLLFMGDAWERSYGDLRWSTIVPERVMPWYFLSNGNGGLHGYGVKTGAGAFCFWQTDPDGVSLWIDISNGGSGVALGDRELLAATVVARRGDSGEDPADIRIMFIRHLSAMSLSQRWTNVASTSLWQKCSCKELRAAQSTIQLRGEKQQRRAGFAYRRVNS